MIKQFEGTLKINFLHFCIVFLLAVNVSHSQDLSLYGNVGYNFPYTKKLLISNNKITKSSYSEGIIIKGGAACFLSKNLGVDLGILYLFNTEKIKITGISEVPFFFKNTNLSFIPSIILQTNIKSLYPYLKFGCSINFVKVNLFFARDYPSYQYTNDYSIGLNSSLGFKLSLNPQFSIFTEFSVMSFTFYADKNVVTWEENGVKKSEEIKVKNKFPGNGFPSSEGAIDFPFTSFSLNMGIMFNL